MNTHRFVLLAIYKKVGMLSVCIYNVIITQSICSTYHKTRVSKQVGRGTIPLARVIGREF